MATRSLRIFQQLARSSRPRFTVSVSTVLGPRCAARGPEVRNMCSEPDYTFETLKVTSLADYVKHVELNRPKKRNAMNTAFWKEMIDCFTKLSWDPDCRVVIFSGAGKIFTAGLDLQENPVFGKMMSGMDDSACKKAYLLQKELPLLQASFNAVEKCNKPVIAAVHNGCIGAGIDLTAACDIRYCTNDAWFQIKEIDIGLAADLGTLQRFPKIIGNDSLCRELIYTARKFYADEAKSIGFVSLILNNKDELMTACLELAMIIASKSPVAVQGSKINLVYSRDHSVPEGLEYITTWNAAMLQSEDVMKAVMGAMQNEVPEFSKL